MCDFCKDIGTDEKAVLTHELDVGDGNSCEYGLREKHRKVIAGNSKRAFAEAVKLEKELKEYGKEKE